MRRRSSIAGGALIKLVVLVALVGTVLGAGLFAWSRVRGGVAGAADAGGEAADGEQTAEGDGEDVLTQTLERNCPRPASAMPGTSPSRCCPARASRSCAASPIAASSRRCCSSASTTRSKTIT